MKQAQNARQQRGRPSSRQGGKSNRGPGNHRNEQKSRGNPKQLVDKYQNQARECLQAGDRMQAEYFFQFAEHYYRVLNENRSNNVNQGANQGERDGPQNNGRHQHSQNGDNSGNDGPQGGRNQRRGRRGRPQDDRQSAQNGEKQANTDKPEQSGQPEKPKQADGSDDNGAGAAASASEKPKSELKPDLKAKKVADQGKADTSDPKTAAQQDNAPTLELNGDAAKPVKRRGPRKRSVPEEKPAAEAAPSPVVSDLS